MNGETKTRNVFANRNYRLVFLGALVSELGALLYSFAVGFYILKISDNNAFLQGLYLALSGAALLLFTPVGGVLGDRVNKAKIMYVCDYVKGGMILLATVLMMILPSPRAHLAILFVRSAGSSLPPPGPCCRISWSRSSCSRQTRISPSRAPWNRSWASFWREFCTRCSL